MVTNLAAATATTALPDMAAAMEDQDSVMEEATLDTVAAMAQATAPARLTNKVRVTNKAPHSV